MIMALGKGTLGDLERLRAKHREKFKAAAPKVRRINQECLNFLCPMAIGRIGLDRGGQLRIKQTTCTWARCPRERR